MTDSPTATLEPHEEVATTRVVEAVASLIDDANAVMVRDDDEAEAATDFLSVLAGEKNRADEARRFLVDPLNAHVKAINERFKGPKAILERADAIVRAKVLTYRAEKERQRQEEIRRLEAEERSRLVAERAELDRQAAAARVTAARAAEAARLVEERAAADAAPADTDVAAQEFAALAAGLAADRAAAPAPRALPVRAPAPARALGSAASRKRWVAEVTHPALVPREFLVVDQRLVNAAVKRGVRVIPGVRIEERDELAVRASR